MNFKTWWVSGSSVWALALILVSGTGGRGFAQTVQDYLVGGEPPTTEDSDYVNLDVKDKDLDEVLKSISRQINVNVIADSNVKEKVTVTLDQVEWRNALKVIAERTRCKIVEESDRLIRFTQPPSISMEFQDAEVKVVLDLLAKQAGTNIVMASDIQGKISLSLREVPWRDALETLVKTAGYVLVKADTTTQSEILRVVRPESLKEQLESRHFQLRYVRPDEPYEATAPDLDKLARSAFETQETTNATQGEEVVAFSLEEALRRVLSKDGDLQYDKYTNTIIVKDIKPKLDEIESIIKLVDVKPPLIYVEVKFVRTANADLLERGIKFDLESTPERDGFQIFARPAQPGEFDGRVINGQDLFDDPLNIFGGSFPFDMGMPLNPYGDFFALGILDFTRTNILLRLVNDDEHSRIVQEPSLSMVDNKPAVIFVGETVPFAVQKIEQDQNGNVTVAIDENSRSPTNVGFTLYLRPHVIPNTDTIDLSVIPNVSALSGTTSDIEGFERFQFQVQGRETFSFIDLPRETRQTVVTYLRVQDGHTAVIGGLQTERRTEIQTKVPLLSSIPILGNLFTWKRKQNNVESLMILITPHILKSVQKEDATYRRRINDHLEADYFYQQYEKGKAKPSAEIEEAVRGEAAETEETAQPTETAPPTEK